MGFGVRKEKSTHSTDNPYQKRKGDSHEIQQEHRLSIVSYMAYSHGLGRVHPNARWFRYDFGGPCHCRGRLDCLKPLDQMPPGWIFWLGGLSSLRKHY